MVEQLRQTPDRLYENVAEVWEALGGRNERPATTTEELKGTSVEPLNDEYMSQLGATLVALLQRRQAAEEEGFLVEVLEIEAAMAALRAELAVVAERRRGNADR